MNRGLRGTMAKATYKGLLIRSIRNGQIITYLPDDSKLAHCVNTYREAKALERLSKRHVQEEAAQVFHEHGAGPYVVNDVVYRIVERGDDYYLRRVCAVRDLE